VVLLFLHFAFAEIWGTGRQQALGGRRQHQQGSSQQVYSFSLDLPFELCNRSKFD